MRNSSGMRRHGVVALVVAVAMVVTGCGADTGASDLSLDGIGTVRPGTLTACTDAPYAPFEFERDGKLRGIDIDLMTAIAAELDITVEFRQVDFSKIFDELAAGGCDVVASSVSLTPERQTKYLFSDGYFEVNQSLLVRSDAGDIRTLDAVPGNHLGVQPGTTGADYVASHAPSATVEKFDDMPQMVAALKAGQIGGIVQDSPINASLAQQDSSLTVAETFTDVQREEYGFVFAKSSERLRGQVNAALERLRTHGEYDEVMRTYLGASQAG